MICATKQQVFIKKWKKRADITISLDNRFFAFRDISNKYLFPHFSPDFYVEKHKILFAQVGIFLYSSDACSSNKLTHLEIHKKRMNS